MKGKTVIITGANTGIGLATARGLAVLGARVFFACRSKEKTLPVLEALMKETGNAQLHFLPLDLSNLDSVRDSASEFLEHHDALHVLIANAGLARQRGVTAQGFESAFGVNHLGHMLFTLLLEKALVKAAPSRVVVVASRAHERTARPIDFVASRAPTASFTGWAEYQQSKLANMLFMYALARRWKALGVHLYGLHPGVIASDIWREMPWPIRPLIKATMRSPVDGARASLHCATSPEAGGETGLYYGEAGEHRRANPLALDEGEQERLWAQSLTWLQPWLPPGLARHSNP